MRDYLYVPLGGNRAGEWRIAGNVMATFLLGGLWHGAGWTFIVWGGLHGAALVICRAWQRTGWRMHQFAAIALTFFFVHVTWIFFRAPSLSDAWRMLTKLVPSASEWAAFMGKISPMQWPLKSLFGLPDAAPATGLILLLAACMVVIPVNSDRLAERFSANARECVFASVLLALGTLTLGQVTQFLYFNF